ncbi:MAG: hypothetical protein MJB14_05485 [Spirochaetes bacterium]|nr:hypothetical protein [Spirochaetota bacterium]
MKYLNSGIDCIQLEKQAAKSKETALTIFCSPVYPLKIELLKNFINQIDIQMADIYFSKLPDHPYYKNFKLADYFRFYDQVIKKTDTPIILIGFGIFSLLFIKLSFTLQERIHQLILIEPDFSNQTLVKIFDSPSKVFFKNDYLIKYYFQKKVPRKYLDKNKLSFLKGLFYSYNQFIQETRIFSELINRKIPFSVFWYVMEKQSWPLAQILVDEYNLSVSALSENIFQNFIKYNKNLLAEFQKIINI